MVMHVRLLRTNITVTYSCHCARQESTWGNDALYLDTIKDERSHSCPGPFTPKSAPETYLTGGCVDTRPDVGAWENTNVYFLSAMKARFLGRPGRRLVAVPTKLSGSRYIHLTTLLVTHTT